MSAPNAKRPRGEVADHHSDADAPWKSALEGKEGQKIVYILYISYAYYLYIAITFLTHIISCHDHLFIQLY